MTEDAKTPEVQAESPKRLVFDYIKSNFFRVIHVDGALGSTTPAGDNIHMALYSERTPIPQQTAFVVKEDLSLGSEILDERVARKAIVREVEVDLIFDLETAVQIARWLENRIEDLKNVKDRIRRIKTQDKKSEEDVKE